MSLTRVKSAGWSTNETLTSAQMSQVDANASFALDKRSGQSDTCASTVTFTGPLTFSNTCAFNGAATFNSTLGVSGAATFSGATSLAGATTAADFTLTGTNRVKLATRSNTRTLSTLWQPVTSGWDFTDTSSSITTNSAVIQKAKCAFSAPDGCTIVLVRVWVQPPTGHGGLSPQFMPQAFLMTKAPGVGAASQIWTTTDTWAGGAYESLHHIDLNGTYTVSRGSNAFYLLVYSESGTNALSGFTIAGVDVACTATNMDDSFFP